MSRDATRRRPNRAVAISTMQRLLVCLSAREGSEDVAATRDQKSRDPPEGGYRFLQGSHDKAGWLVAKWCASCHVFGGSKVLPNNDLPHFTSIAALTATPLVRQSFWVSEARSPPAASDPRSFQPEVTSPTPRGGSGERARSRGNQPPLQVH